jgi:hypothetical protein
MSKSAKKRNKKYRGIDARRDENIVRVHEVQAVARSDRAQWLYEHRKMLRNIGIGVGVVIIVVVLILIKW